ncbi:lysozyme inhibitor LprI family protein [Actibacterium sp. XHP0104]|uniref:lysozyme inhibitor LprI family protein n=1 Tax=Actibacterium sp. XHP0104 TaxID=2984335 RepID=UPI0021E7BB9F|nr:lysozyme inhibitor LprI family protein [Actibacterium sp. XHP0104]MCV2880674.1 DUF1311 domain-containing protein [Actibacterium sp. XHP0104]
MKRLFIATAMAVCAGAAAQAQDIRFDIALTQACLAGLPEGAAPDACIGVSANACIEATPDGYTTVGMGICHGQELGYWDTRLNAAYGQLRDRHQAADAELDQLGSAAPRRAPALQEMQRAWIAYRDATCDYERSYWGGGTGGGPATVACHMRLTAGQALYLETELLAD